MAVNVVAVDRPPSKAVCTKNEAVAFGIRQPNGTVLQLSIYFDAYFIGPLTVLGTFC